MKAGLYKIKNIEDELALLTSVGSEEHSYTFPVKDFTHQPTPGDVVEVWLDGDIWKTKYREEETGSAKSHTLDFFKRITDSE